MGEGKMDSNIIVGSNVFHCSTDDPRLDHEFADQIVDYSRVKDLSNRQKIDRRIPNLSGKQEKILRTEIRCTYAKNDPCWGYSKKYNKIICVCINGNCPAIRECNPRYSSEEASYWIDIQSEKDLYGLPDKQPLYYKVDMVSDEEMLQYDVFPSNEGLEYPTIKNPVISEKRVKKLPETRIDPLTGRKEVVIGYRWIITDQASYESEELIPIWGFVDEFKPVHILRKKSQTIQKKTEKIIKKRLEERFKAESIDSYYAYRDLYEKSVKENICMSFKLTDIDMEYFSDQKNMVVLANEAEKAYVSCMLLKNGVHHGFSVQSEIQLVSIDEITNFSFSAIIWISSTVLKNGCLSETISVWKQLAGIDNISQIDVPAREYYNFSYADGGKNRWCCRNMYGVTHVCVNDIDIMDLFIKQDGEYLVTLAEENDSYIIKNTYNETIGHLGKEFSAVIDALKKAGEITDRPSSIEGVTIIVKGKQISVLGMGHLKFDEY